MAHPSLGISFKTKSKVISKFSCEGVSDLNDYVHTRFILIFAVRRRRKDFISVVKNLLKFVSTINIGVDLYYTLLFLKFLKAEL